MADSSTSQRVPEETWGDTVTECPRCGSQKRYFKRDAGRNSFCPACRKEFRLPIDQIEVLCRIHDRLENVQVAVWIIVVLGIALPWILFILRR